MSKILVNANFHHIAALREFEAASFSPAAIRVHAMQFSKSQFQREMQTYIEQKSA